MVRKVHLNRRISARLCVVLVSISTLSVNVPSSHAFFGWSACEKVKNEIKSQDNIGYALWKIYEATWKLHVKDPKNTDLDTQVVYEFSNLINSDLSLDSLAVKHPKCFNAAQNANLITYQTTGKISLSHAQSWVTPSVPNWDGFWTKDPYPSYEFLLTNLKSVK